MGSAGGKQRGGRGVCGFLCLSMLSFFFSGDISFTSTAGSAPTSLSELLLLDAKKAAAKGWGAPGLRRASLVTPLFEYKPKREPGVSPRSSHFICTDEEWKDGPKFI